MPLLETYTVEHIQIAPFKSGNTISLSEARITPSGLETVDGLFKDHEFFVVRNIPDANGLHHFITQRFSRDPNYPKDPAESFRKLALIQPEIMNRDQDLVVSWGGKEYQVVPKEVDPAKVLQVKLWEYEGGAVKVPALTEWLRDVSKYDVRVVKTAGPWNRLSRQNYLPNNNPIRAQDGYPIHPILIEDVEAISDWFNPVPWKRFRPQIVLAGQPAWSLHKAFGGEIEGVRIVQPKPCGRCEVPRIDQETGEFSNVKPLVEIRKVRPQWVNKDGELDTIFGENWLPDGSAIIKVGSKFKVTSYRNPPLEFKWRDAA